MKNTRKPTGGISTISEKGNSKALGFFQHITLQACLLFVFAFCLYANTLRHEYVFDDVVVIQNNSLVQKGFEGIPDLLTKDSFYGYFKGGNDLSGGRYRPLSLVSFAIEKQLFGSNAPAGHFNNVLFYSFGIVLLFFTLKKLLSPEWKKIPFLATLLFAAHPIHTEVVANIKSRDEIFCMIFLLLTLLFHLKFLSGSKIPDRILSLVFFALALLSKETAFTFLLIIPLAVYFFTNTEIKKNLLSALPLFTLALLFLIARSHFAGTVGDRESADIMGNPYIHASFMEKYASITGVLGRYLLSSVYPFVMGYDYSYNQIPVTGWSNPFNLLSLLIITGLLGFAFLKLKSKNEYSFCILYFFIALSIVSNFFFPVGAPMADRFLFLPVLGSALAFSFLISKTIKNKAVLISLFSIVLALYSIRTFSRNADWKSNLSLFKADVEHVPNNVRARVNYGSLLMSNSEQETDKQKKTELLQEAFKQFQAAVVIHPEYADAYNHLGSYYSILGIQDSAVENFSKAVRYKPGFHSFESNLIHALIAKGNTLFGKGNFLQAVVCYRKVSDIDPANPGPLDNMGITYMNIGMNDSAEACFNREFILSPGSNAKNNLANLYLRKGNEALNANRNDEALKFYETAIKNNPDFSDAWCNAGSVYVRKKQTGTAIEYLRRSISINPNNKIALNNLISCLEQTGNHVKAEEYRKMLSK